MEKRNVGTKEKNPRQDLSNAKDLTLTCAYSNVYGRVGAHIDLRIQQCVWAVLVPTLTCAYSNVYGRVGAHPENNTNNVPTCSSVR